MYFFLIFSFILARYSVAFSLYFTFCQWDMLRSSLNLISFQSWSVLFILCPPSLQWEYCPRSHKHQINIFSKKIYLFIYFQARAGKRDSARKKLERKWQEKILTHTFWTIYVLNPVLSVKMSAVFEDYHKIMSFRVTPTRFPRSIDWTQPVTS